MNIAIILSGGIGTRIGKKIPKQYIEIGGKPIINYCIETFLQNNNIDALVIVVSGEWQEFVENVIKAQSTNKSIFYAKSGETRQYSIYNALKTMRINGFKDDDIIIIHDAARPLISNNLINRCINECNNADGILPVVPVKDTIYFSEDGHKIHSLLNRSYLWAGQAPEAFRFGKYIEIHEKLTHEELLQINGSTEIAFKYGLNCHLIEGDPMNFKITTPEDLSNFESILNNNR